MPPRPRGRRPLLAGDAPPPAARGRGRGARGGRRRGRGRRASQVRAPRLPGASPLESLPPTLFHLVLSFCLSGVRRYPVLRKSPADRELDELAFVSKAFRAQTLEIGGQLSLSKLLVDATYTWTRDVVTRARHRAAQCSAFLRELEIHADPPGGPNVAEWRRAAGREIAAIVSLAPQLEMLDLRHFRGDSKEVVDAAARSCPKLKSLLLRSLSESAEWQSIGPLADAVFAGMEQWHKNSGGLRQLRLPDRHSGTAFQNSTDFVERIVRYCPKIELLDGSYTKDGDVMLNQDRWIINRAAWEQFCATCANLREFDWISVPWNTNFFEIFGSHKKPRLTSLTLRTSMEWDWDSYFNEVGRDEAAMIRRHGFGATAQKLARVLSACPSLKKLSIIANSDVDDSDSTHEYMDEMNESERPDVDPPHFKAENRLTTEVVGDSFCKTLVQCCPLLEEFTLTEDYALLAAHMGSDEPNARFRDSALNTLAKLKHLSRLKLPKVDVSGKAIFDILNWKDMQAHGTRYYYLTLGHETDEEQKRFYTAIQKSLNCLLDFKQPREIASKRIYVEIKNGHDFDMEHQWCVGYFKRLKATLKGVRRKYPTMAFRVEVEGLEDDTFARILSFGFYTKSAEVPSDSKWIDVPEFALEDGVFVLAEVLDDEDDDYDDEYGDWGDPWNHYSDDYSDNDGSVGDFDEEDEYHFGSGWD